MADIDLNTEINALKRDLDRLQTDFGKLAQDTGRATKEATAAAIAKLEDEGKVLMERLRSAGQQATEKGGEAVHAVQERIEERPMMAASTALGLGFILGILLSRKS